MVRPEPSCTFIHVFGTPLVGPWFEKTWWGSQLQWKRILQWGEVSHTQAPLPTHTVSTLGGQLLYSNHAGWAGTNVGESQDFLNPAWERTGLEWRTRFGRQITLNNYCKIQERDYTTAWTKVGNGLESSQAVNATGFTCGGKRKGAKMTPKFLA